MRTSHGSIEHTVDLISSQEPQLKWRIITSKDVFTCSLYCPKCELIIAKKSELESLMATCCERMNPDVIGNEYVTVGTVSLEVWMDISAGT